MLIDSDIEFNDYPGNKSIMNDIADYIDNEFYSEGIKEQIEDGLDCSTVNYLEQIEEKFGEVKEKYDESDWDSNTIFMQSLYGNIANWIADKYQVEIEVDSEYLEHASRELYNFFVINIKQLTTYFLIAYINENVESLVRDIPEDRLSRQILDRIKVPVDEYKYIAASNIEEVITQIGHMDFDIETFLRYAGSTGDVDFDLGYVYSDEEDQSGADRNWTISDDSGNMVSAIISQVTNGEYDRRMSVEITDSLINLWDIKSHIEDNNKTTKPVVEGEDTNE